MRSLYLCLALFGLCLTACPPVGPGNEDTADGAFVDEWAAANCARTFECFPGASISRAFGDDQDDCAARLAAYKRRSNAAPGTAADQRLDECRDALLAASCDDFSDSFFGDVQAMPACWLEIPGDLAVGEPCAYGAQCATNYCQSAEGSCGVCAELAQLGGLCGNRACDLQEGLVCGFDGECHAGARRGESCDQDTLCTAGLQCPQGTCVPNLGLGDSCDPNVGNCRFVTDALVCNNQTLQCEEAAIVAAGDDCGFGVPSGGMNMCGAGTLCDMTTPTTINPYSGTCVEADAAAVGESCAFENPGINGSACAETDARCESGTCVVDDPESCG